MEPIAKDVCIFFYNKCKHHVFHSVTYHCSSVTYVLYNLIAAMLQLYRSVFQHMHAHWYRQISSTHCFPVTSENCAHVITFFVQNDLGNNILKLWNILYVQK
jgi:hypothetical protein